MTKEYEPFDLGRALAGEPVVLRDGQKAYVRYYETELYSGYPLLGMVLDGGSFMTAAWTLSGGSNSAMLDIVGMCPQYKLIHGVKVPVFPDWEPKKGEEYYAVEILSPHFYRTLVWGGEWLDLLLQKRGLIYPATDAGNQAAILHAKAMLGIAEDNDAPEQKGDPLSVQRLHWALARMGG